VSGGPGAAGGHADKGTGNCTAEVPEVTEKTNERRRTRRSRRDLIPDRLCSAFSASSAVHSIAVSEPVVPVTAVPSVVIPLGD
jgi:hypothetical protein